MTGPVPLRLAQGVPDQQTSGRQLAFAGEKPVHDPTPRRRECSRPGKASNGRHAKGGRGQRCPLLQAGLAAASGIPLAHRIVSRSGRISDMPMTPPTSMMTPQIMKPVLKPSSGVTAVSTTLPMT